MTGVCSAHMDEVAMQAVCQNKTCATFSNTPPQFNKHKQTSIFHGFMHAHISICLEIYACMHAYGIQQAVLELGLKLALLLGRLNNRQHLNTVVAQRSPSINISKLQAQVHRLLLQHTSRSEATWSLEGKLRGP